MIEPMLLTLVGAIVLAGAAYDAATLTIPNWVSLVLLALFPIAALVAGLNWTEVGIHFAIGFAALAGGMALFAAGMIGGGDAKMFAALSLYVGAANFGAYILAVAMAGGVLACALLALRRFAWLGLLERLQGVKHLAINGAGIPYGIAIAAGALTVLPVTRLFMASPH
jgi:prepilin peptidase CpaA